MRQVAIQSTIVLTSGTDEGEDVNEHAHLEYLCSASGACRAPGPSSVSACSSSIDLQHRALNANAGFGTTFPLDSVPSMHAIKLSSLSGEVIRLSTDLSHSL